jgi:hypothetical protein
LGPLAGGPLSVALVALLLGIWIALRLIYRWDPLPSTPRPDGPVGIRSWLLIPAVVVFLSPYASCKALYNFAHYLEVDRWQRLHETVPEPWQAWAPAVLLVLTACGVCLLAAEAVLIYLFFSRRSSAPTVFIVVHWLGVLYLGALLWFPSAAGLSNPVNGAWLTGVLSADVIRQAIYTAYLLRSKRVKATFVARLAQRQAAQATAATQPQHASAEL